MRPRAMSKLTFGAATAVTLGLLAALAPAADAHQAPRGSAHEPAHGQALKRIGYFTQWGIYGRNFQVKDLETSGTAAKLSHINYAFGVIGADGKCLMGNAPAPTPGPTTCAPSTPRTPWTAPATPTGSAWPGTSNELRELKAKHPGLKVMISLGGWSGSAHFSDAVRTDAGRKALVASCVDTYIKGDLPVDGARGGAGAAAGIFDGVDLDWEWPGSDGAPGNVIRPEDKPNFTKLVREFRVQLDAYGRSLKKRKHYELSAYVPTAPAKIDAGFEVAKIMRDFDFVNLQGYDFHVSGEARTAQQSALYAKDDFSVDQTVRAWLRRGAPARKLVVGMPFTARAGPA